MTDQLAAVKAEDEKLKRERDELIRKEAMADMFLRRENSTFWDTPGMLYLLYFDKPSLFTTKNYFQGTKLLQLLIGTLCPLKFCRLSLI